MLHSRNTLSIIVTLLSIHLHQHVTAFSIHSKNPTESTPLITTHETRRDFLHQTLQTFPLIAPILTSTPSTANALNLFGSNPLLREKALTPLSTLDPNYLKSPGTGTNPSPIPYPPLFAGDWTVSHTFLGKTYPLGDKFVPTRIRARGSLRRDEDVPGDVVTFPQKFLQEENAVVYPDRIYNIRQQINANRGYDEVAEVLYDPSRQRVRILQTTLGPDFRPLPPARNEIFITNHASEYTFKDDAGVEKKISKKDVVTNPPYHFTTMEFMRTVTLGARTAYVLETATYSTYDIETDGDTIRGRQRYCLFLPPLPTGEEGENYFEAANRAVAVYDFDVSFKRS